MRVVGRCPFEDHAMYNRGVVGGYCLAASSSRVVDAGVPLVSIRNALFNYSEPLLDLMSGRGLPRSLPVNLPVILPVCR